MVGSVGVDEKKSFPLCTIFGIISDCSGSALALHKANTAVEVIIGILLSSVSRIGRVLLQLAACRDS